MHKKFDHQEIEQKWQKRWQENGIYDVGTRDPQKEKEYVLVEWPYPSGNLHIGHWYAFAVPDIYVRTRRMQGKQVVFPIGFDAFGLPAENAAIKRNLDPKEWTESNIEFMRGQLRSMGNAFSWNLSTSSTDQDYYAWTQWMFTKFFENDIAYRGVGIVNWCPSCNTVLANEQVIADACERCGAKVEKKEMEEWKMRITKYADRLIDDLDELQWPEHIKESQRNWIGRSGGWQIDFALHDTTEKLRVFTTRPDTLYGATYVVLAPEHPLLDTLKARIANWDQVAAYRRSAAQKNDIERTNATKDKTGVQLEGVTAINPVNNEQIPVYIADYVLASYGTGAIMAVPAHDARDGEFARKFTLPIRQVIAQHLQLPIKEGVETIDRGDVVDLIIEHPSDGTFLLQREMGDEGDHVHFVGGGTEGEPHDIAIGRELLEETGFTEYEVLGLIDVASAIAYRHTKDKNQITKSHFYHIKLKSLSQQSSEVEEGKHTIEWRPKEDVEKLITWTGHANAWQTFVHGHSYTGAGRLIHSGEFDGMDSEEAKVAIATKVGGVKTNTYRLRDWSVGRQRYWGVPIPIVYDPEGKPHAIPKEHLPWVLPTDVDFRPTGEPPLAKSQELKERTERIFGAGWRPEVETMDAFVDSSWYFLRYIDATNTESLSAISAQKDWMPVDLYFGGSEHTTMHVLYSRFWQKALFDLSLVTTTEPYKVRINRGLVLGPDGNKMSKSKGNVIDPDEQVARLGADTVKMYLAFMGPYGEITNYPWDMGGIAGIRRFLERANGLREHITSTEPASMTRLLHKTIRKLTVDIDQYKFNTSISTLMVFVNDAEKGGMTNETYHTFLRLLAPFAPHLTEELWAEAGHTTSIHLASWPSYDPALTEDSEVTMAVQINGKARGTITVSVNASEEDALAAARQSAVASRLEGKVIKKVIYVPKKILNILIAE